MNAPVLLYQLDAAGPRAFAELDEVRLLAAITTDDGTIVPAGSEGTVVATWAEGAAFEVEFDQGLVTVEAASLTLASAR